MYTLERMLAKPHLASGPVLYQVASLVPISGLVVTFRSAVTDHSEAVEAMRRIPEIDIGEALGSKLAIVVDSETKRRDQEIWDMVQQLTGIVDLAVAMVAFDDDDQSIS
jgi:nitrate reductase NapAB chaperone NapD